MEEKDAASDQWRLQLPRRLAGGLAVTVVVSGLIWLLGFWLPQLFPRTLAMEMYQSQHFVVWAEGDDHRSAIELRSMLEDRGGRALAFLRVPGFPAAPTEFFIYRDRQSFSLHRGGVWAAWSDRAGRVMSASRGRYLLVSPDNPGLANGHEAVIMAALAAWIRAQLQGAAPRATLWLAEGVVAYLAGASRGDEQALELPPAGLLVTASPEAFLAAGGDRYADAFVAWLIYRYGGDMPLRLLQAGPDWLALLHRSLPEVYADWQSWMLAGRPWDSRLASDLPPVDGGE